MKNISLYCVLFVSGLIVTVVGQQKSVILSGQDFSPEGALFTISVPSKALPAQGHIFDPMGDMSVYSLVERGEAKAFNFETKKGGKRSFIASILQITPPKKSRPRFITDSKAEIINTFIGDEIRLSEITKTTNRNRKTSQWSYRRLGSAEKTEGEDGIVLVQSTEKHLYIIVVEVDHLKIDDPEIKVMLDSFKPID